MKIWTAHEKRNAAPLLVREGFSIGALLFGPLWLLLHRAWLPAAAVVLLTVLMLILANPPVSLILMLALALLVGFSGRDLVRWSVTRRGYVETAVVTGRNEDEAHLRLLDARPDLVERTMVAETAP